MGEAVTHEISMDGALQRFRANYFFKRVQDGRGLAVSNVAVGRPIRILVGKARHGVEICGGKIAVALL